MARIRVDVDCNKARCTPSSAVVRLCSDMLLIRQKFSMNAQLACRAVQPHAAINRDLDRILRWAPQNLVVSCVAPSSPIRVILGFQHATGPGLARTWRIDKGSADSIQNKGSHRQ